MTTVHFMLYGQNLDEIEYEVEHIPKVGEIVGFGGHGHGEWLGGTDWVVKRVIHQLNRGCNALCGSVEPPHDVTVVMFKYEINWEEEDGNEADLIFGTKDTQ